MSVQDELTTTAFLAVRRLTQIQKAGFLLNTALALIDDGQYGEEVETYLNVYLKTPGLPKADVKKAMLAQRNARKSPGGRLQLDQLNRGELPCKEIHFSIDPACQRIPPEIWEQIATYTPRYYLRDWLFLSPLLREIASRHIFHTVDVYLSQFGECDPGLDILVRAINDPVWASKVKSLHVEWNFEYDQHFFVILRILKMSLSALKALRNFEWIGTPEMPVEMIQVLLNTHKCLQVLGLRGNHFEALAASSGFQNLRKFTFFVNESDEKTDLVDIRVVLDQNENTLKHLILGGCSDIDDSLDTAFESVTINNLTHLDLFGTFISSFVLDRITSAHNLQSLTLHGTFVEPAQMFAIDSIERTPTVFPHLESFRFVMQEGNNDLYESVVHFLRKREKIRRLDLGRCPWNLVQDVLADMRNLKVLAVCIENLSEEEIEFLVEEIPTQMVAIKLSVDVSDKPLDEYAHYFACFNTLSFLHVISPTKVSLSRFATTLTSLDFLACGNEHHVVVRSDGDTDSTVKLQKLQTSNRLEYGSGDDVVSEDIAWLQQNENPEE